MLSVKSFSAGQITKPSGFCRGAIVCKSIRKNSSAAASFGMVSMRWRLVREGDFVVDVGANIGVVSCAMAACVGPGGRVLAIEMMPDTFRRLKSNVDRWGNDRTAVQCFNIALSDRAGEVTVGLSADFEINKGVAFVSHQPIPRDCVALRVPSITLSQLPIDREITLLKIDVERHEEQVLLGASTLLQARSVRHIVFEDWEVANTPAKKLLAAFGYTVWCLRAGPFGLRLRPPPADDRLIHVDCLATLDPNSVRAAFAKPGYRALKRQRSDTPLSPSRVREFA